MLEMEWRNAEERVGAEKLAHHDDARYGRQHDRSENSAAPVPDHLFDHEEYG